jgi:hypothetical protein
MWQRQTSYPNDMEVIVRHLNKTNKVSRVFFTSVFKRITITTNEKKKQMLAFLLDPNDGSDMFL